MGAGQTMAIDLKPGSHIISLKTPSGKSVEKIVTVEAAHSAVEILAPQPSAIATPAQSAPYQTLNYRAQAFSKLELMLMADEEIKHSGPEWQRTTLDFYKKQFSETAHPNVGILLAVGQYHRALSELDAQNRHVSKRKTLQDRGLLPMLLREMAMLVRRRRFRYAEPHCSRSESRTRPSKPSRKL